MRKEMKIEIENKEYTEVIDYHVAQAGLQMQYIGYVDILDKENLVYHVNLTTRNYKELMKKTNEEIEKIVMEEATELIGEPLKQEINEFIEMYEDAIKKGRYQIEEN